MESVSSRHGVVTVALCALIALFLTACGNDDSGDNQPQAAAEPVQLDVTTRDFDFDAPESVPGGVVEITLSNDGKKSHQVQLLMLNDGVQFADFEEILKTDRTGEETFANSTAAGGVTGIAPGDTATVTNELEPGTYALVCFVEGHHTKGMISQLEVTEPERVQAQAPSTEGQISLSDFEIILPEGFTGQGAFEVVNNGPSPHEMDVFKIDASVEDVEKYLENPKGPPPGGEPEGVGGAAALDVGSSAFVDLDLQPGVYVFACFVPDDNGEPHFNSGMHQVFEVTG